MDFKTQNFFLSYNHLIKLKPKNREQREKKKFEVKLNTQKPHKFINTKSILMNSITKLNHFQIRWCWWWMELFPMVLQQYSCWVMTLSASVSCGHNAVGISHFTWHNTHTHRHSNSNRKPLLTLDDFILFALFLLDAGVEWEKHPNKCTKLFQIEMERKPGRPT